MLQCCCSPQQGENNSARGTVSRQYWQQHSNTAQRAMLPPMGPHHTPARLTGPSWSHPTGTATIWGTPRSGSWALGGPRRFPTDYESSLGQPIRHAACALSHRPLRKSLRTRMWTVAWAYLLEKIGLHGELQCCASRPPNHHLD